MLCTVSTVLWTARLTVTIMSHVDGICRSGAGYHRDSGPAGSTTPTITPTEGIANLNCVSAKLLHTNPTNTALIGEASVLRFELTIMPPFLGSSPPEFSSSPSFSRRRIRQAEAMRHFERIDAEHLFRQESQMDKLPVPRLRPIHSVDQGETSRCVRADSGLSGTGPEIKWSSTNHDVLTVLFSYLVKVGERSCPSGTALARCAIVCESWRFAANSEELWSQAFCARWNCPPPADEPSLRCLYARAAGARVLCWGSSLSRGPAWAAALDGQGVREVSAGSDFVVALTWSGQVCLDPPPRPAGSIRRDKTLAQRLAAALRSSSVRGIDVRRPKPGRFSRGETTASASAASRPIRPWSPARPRFSWAARWPAGRAPGRAGPRRCRAGTGTRRR